MPLYLCRWPNGDCSVVWARTKEGAIAELDEVANAEGCPIIALHQFQMHFTLTEKGIIALESMGEETEVRVYSWAYPLLDRVRSEVYGEEGATEETLRPDQQAKIQAAIEQERERVEVDPASIPEPDTELGQEIKRQTGMATSLINRTIRRSARKLLENFEERGKPH